MNTRFARILFLATFATLCPVSTSIAATIPFTSATTLALYPNNSLGCCLDTGYNPDNHSSPPAPASQSTTVSGAWGNVTATADANLQTGQLKAQAAVTANNYSGFMPYGQSNATFGDGFTTLGTNGSPFVWQPNSTAKFTMNLGGTLSFSGYDLGNSTTGAFVILTTLKHGTLDPAAFSPSTPPYDLTVSRGFNDPRRPGVTAALDLQEFA